MLSMAFKESLQCCDGCGMMGTCCDGCGVIGDPSATPILHDQQNPSLTVLIDRDYYLPNLGRITSESSFNNIATFFLFTIKFLRLHITYYNTYN